METPAAYLPACTVDDVYLELSKIAFPMPQEIQELRHSGQYHKVFRLEYSNTVYEDILLRTGLSRNRYRNPSFVMRVSGCHFPNFKTSNEVGILTYLTASTSVPVPGIVHYNDSSSNSLRNEYMIMTYVRGQVGSDVFFSLTENQVSQVLDQLATICLDLFRLEFEYIGGIQLEFDASNSKFPQRLIDAPTRRGPPIMETMWQLPDIERYFNKFAPEKETNNEVSEQQMEFFTTLNAVSSSGYLMYTSWLAAQMQVHIRAIEFHSTLQWIHKADPNLEALIRFTALLSDPEYNTVQEKLNSDVAYKLAHRDLHFGNILLAPSSATIKTETRSGTTTTAAASDTEDTHYQITGILDWEFATILPFPLWKHSFLLPGFGVHPPPNYQGDPDGFNVHCRVLRDDLYGQWAREVSRRLQRQDAIGKRMLAAARWTCPEQEAAWDVVNYLRCIVEVCPREKQFEDARRWWDEVVRLLRVFDIDVGSES